MFVLAKDNFRFQAWRPHDYADRFEWVSQQFLKSIETVPDPKSAILQELDRITARMLAGETLSSNELLLHVALENMSDECLIYPTLQDRIAHHKRVQDARNLAPIYDADEEILLAAMLVFDKNGTMHSQNAYDAADRLRERDPMNPTLWDFIENVALPTLLNIRGDATGFGMLL